MDTGHREIERAAVGAELEEVARDFFEWHPASDGSFQNVNHHERRISGLL
jgi:hypothetical protein